MKSAQQKVREEQDWLESKRGKNREMIRVEGVAQMHKLKVKAVLKIILNGANHLGAKQNKITIW